jgi:pSer/pThr/pTyr-binding forkhead associated (FHA) protein
MAKSWTIGAASDCDLIVDQPTVSRYHCRLIQSGGRYLLQDLGSSNGTYVNGARAAGLVDVRPADSITLGTAVPLPWPGESATFKVALLIGREPDNDVVVDYPEVSARHALVVWEGTPGQAVIEDLGSSNGTGVGSPGSQARRAMVNAADTIYLGSHPIPAAIIVARVDVSQAARVIFDGREIVIGRDAGNDTVVDAPSVSGRHARLYRSGNRIILEDLGSTNGTFQNGTPIEREATVRNGDVIGLGSVSLVLAVDTMTPALARPNQAAAHRIAGSEVTGGEAVWQPWRLAGLVLQAPAVALILGATARLVAGSQATAAVLTGISVAAIWFGLSTAVLSGLVDPGELRDPGRNPARLLARLALLLPLAIVQCVLAWLVVAPGAGLRAPAAPSIAMLVLGSAVGLALGLVVRMCSFRPAIAGALVAGAVLSCWLLGGGAGPLSGQTQVRSIGGILPSRWVFEGLVLLEAEARPAAVDRDAEGNLAERYFPASTERHGLRAAALALGFMVLGAIAAVSLLVWAAQPAGRGRPTASIEPAG